MVYTTINLLSLFERFIGVWLVFWIRPKADNKYHKFPDNCKATVKVLNFQTLENCCNHPKILTNWSYSREMPPKDADRIANSEDPDQTAPLGAV